jgi:hypothetical protein
MRKKIKRYFPMVMLMSSSLLLENVDGSEVVFVVVVELMVNFVAVINQRMV